MNLDTDYGGWLTEDLEDLITELYNEKLHVESYSERAELNIQIHEIKGELILRKNETIHTG
tara:strand:- start:962 stop:1144 length:183 start_codon:yes stop_codon:yes gene_type:complete